VSFVHPGELVIQCQEGDPSGEAAAGIRQKRRADSAGTICQSSHAVVILALLRFVMICCFLLFGSKSSGNCRLSYHTL
jgi:hypothetical protein